MSNEIVSGEQKDECILKILNPVGILNYKPMSPAKRLSDLNHKKIGLYWNNKARGDAALRRVKELLSERFEGLRFEWFESATSHIPSQKPDALRKWFQDIERSGVSAVVASTGD